ncbi:Tetratricopeptide repeat protein 38 [Tyrophagus putrescentiae]|nr:Tetratricopeptide repeat protein 38 [Tyrophagus putrescentiae]
MFRSNWFDFEAWQGAGLAISSTTSVEAVKMYDAVVSQFIGWYDDPAVGGLMGAVKRMRAADPDFILGNSFALSMSPGNYFDGDSPLRTQIDALEATAEQQRGSITEREYRHAMATVASAKMDWGRATGLWEAILAEAPNDVHALKMAFFTYFYGGRRDELFGMVERAYKAQEKEDKLKAGVHWSLMHAQYGFVLQEADRFKEAEVYVKRGLAADRRDGWAAHSMAHICEMSGRFEEGARFLDQEEEGGWARANHLASHNHWHRGLFHLAQGEWEGALGVFDRHLEPNFTSNRALYGLADASSLLQRMLFVLPENRSSSFETCDVEKRFKAVFEVARDHLDGHDLGYTDAHLLATLTERLCSALVEYSREQYEKAAETMESIRREHWAIGGSNAQRDVFNQLHLAAAVRSGRAEHKRVLKELTEEREALAEGDKWLLRKVVVVREG